MPSPSKVPGKVGIKVIMQQRPSSLQAPSQSNRACALLMICMVTIPWPRLSFISCHIRAHMHSWHAVNLSTWARLTASLLLAILSRDSRPNTVALLRTSLSV